jgi:hypothetical protein
MARAKLTARKHVRTSPCRNVVPTESHSDGQRAGYFPRTLQTVLLALVSYPVFTPKPSTHRMHDLGSIVRHIRPKVFTDNQMS